MKTYYLVILDKVKNIDTMVPSKTARIDWQEEKMRVTIMIRVDNTPYTMEEGDIYAEEELQDWLQKIHLASDRLQTILAKQAKANKDWHGTYTISFGEGAK